jgi:hypothetical protein
MAQIITEPGSLFQILFILASFLISFFLITTSIFNQDFKAIVFLLGFIFTYIISIGFGNIMPISKSVNINRLPVCNLVSVPGMSDDQVLFSPISINTLFLAYTTIYLIAPMFHNGNFNLPVVVVLFTLLFGNAYHLLTNSCESIVSISAGVLLGFVLGSAVFLSILQSGNGELLYFGEVMSNNAVCKVDRKKYICFKDGKQLKFE